jgi:hypothetical protein
VSGRLIHTHEQRTHLLNQAVSITQRNTAENNIAVRIYPEYGRLNLRRNVGRISINDELKHRNIKACMRTDGEHLDASEYEVIAAVTM